MIGRKKFFYLFFFIIGPVWPITYWMWIKFILARLDGRRLHKEFVKLLVHEHIQNEAGLTIFLLIELFDEFVEV